MSAQYRTLMLPELVARILHFLRNDGNSLAACIRLNTLWAVESARILWAVHSTESGMHGDICTRQQCLMHTTCRLSEMAKSGRLQWYAGFICHLSFVHYGTTDYSTFNGILFQSLEILKLLQPCSFYNRDNPRALDVGNLNILQFLQPRLRYLQIEISRLPDDFFVTLLNQCPLLQELHITIRRRPFDLPRISNSAIGLPDYLLTTSCLKKIVLRIWQNRTEIWSPEVFLALAKNRHIQSLTVPPILSDWTLSLQGFPTGTLFRKMHRVTASIDEAGLARLAPHFRDVVKLDLKVQGPSLRLIATVANLTALLFLRLSFNGCTGTGTIRSEDLTLLARNCRGLFFLHILGNDHITSLDLNDTIMDSIALNLPNLSSLELHLLGTSLTEKTLLSLGRRCLELKNCSICARVSYEDLFEVEHRNLFQRLRTLKTYQREEIACPSDPDLVAVRLQRAAPMLECLHHYDDDCTFEEFDGFHKAIREAYGDRYNSIDLQPMSGSGSR